MNSTLEGSTKVAAYFVIRTIFLDQALHDTFIPHNDGMIRPVRVIAPEGSLFNPRFPRASYARFPACQIACDSVLLALASAVPERVCAGTGAEVHVIAFSGIDEESRAYWVYVQLNESSWGGRLGKDGMDSIGCLMENIRNNPIEEEELRSRSACCAMSSATRGLRRAGGAEGLVLCGRRDSWVKAGSPLRRNASMTRRRGFSEARTATRLRRPYDRPTASRPPSRRSSRHTG